MLRWLLLLVATTPLVRAGSLHQVWKFDAEQAPNPPDVYAVSFSPDGQHILAIVGTSWQEESVIVLDTADPKVNRRLEINPQVSISDPSGAAGISWSPSSDKVILRDKVVDLLHGTFCSAPVRAFAGADRMVTTDYSRTRKFDSSPKVFPYLLPPLLVTYDANCGDREIWELGGSWGLLDVSPDRGLVAIWRDVREGAPPAVILDAKTLRPTRGLQWPDPPPLMMEMTFADSGRALCGRTGKDWDEGLRCVNTDTGEEVASTKGWTWLVWRTAARATRVVLTEYGRNPDFIDFRWTRGSLKRRVIWDFETGKQVVSWRPKSDYLVTQAVPRREKQPYRFDISADGNYLVEAGAGAITLYRIEP